VALAPSTHFETELADIASRTGAVLDSLLVMQNAAAPRLVQAMRYASLGAGKRLRPFFVVAGGRLFDVAEENALRVGAALECVHCYSLVHDDLPAMDNDDLRRGKPTVHRAFGEATAILAGDSLLTLAFQILADPATHGDPTVRTELIGELARAAGKDGMAGGQMLDLQAEGGSGSIEEIMHMQAMKTGALFGFACVAGAILGRGDPSPLRQYADNIGLAFQIADDILDVESTPQSLGKATQKDKVKGKATFVDMLGLEAAKAKAAELISVAVTVIEPFGAKAQPLRDAARFIVARKQ
jgi:farnesyl diphosphate synthase